MSYRIEEAKQRREGRKKGRKQDSKEGRGGESRRDSEGSLASPIYCPICCTCRLICSHSVEDAEAINVSVSISVFSGDGSESVELGRILLLDSEFFTDSAVLLFLIWPSEAASLCLLFFSARNFCLLKTYWASTSLRGTKSKDFFQYVKDR
jgi:hypothetical protein